MFTRRAVLLGSVSIAVASAGCTEGGLEDVQETVLGAEDRGDIVGIYDQGIGQLNDANETRDAGIIAFNEERFGDSIGSLETSIEHYADATDSFREAETMAEEAGVPPAVGICDEAASHAELMRESTLEAREAASAAEAGESAADINGHTETSQELQAEAEELTVSDPETLLDVLEARE